MTDPSRDQRPAHPVREWFAACLHACLNLFEYGEIDPELRSALAVVPSKADFVVELWPSPYYRVVIGQPPNGRLIPWACALFGPHCPSSVCADPHCRYRDK
jgi:hypothetical protein